MRPKITIRTIIDAPIEKIWECWIQPDHITQWAFASDDWIVPRAINDMRPGGKFTTRMEAKDGSAGFDFEGTYDVVEQNKKVEYIISDGRKVWTEFIPREQGCEVVQTFEAEDENSQQKQQEGWQAILNNFKNYVLTAASK